MRKLLSILILLLVISVAYAQIKINSSNVELYRDSVKQKIFGQTSLPVYLPNTVQTGVTSLAYMSINPFSSTENLKRIDRHVIKLNNNIKDVNTYVYVPTNSNGNLFIYHSGHCHANAAAEDMNTNGNNSSTPVISRLLAEGFTVLAVPQFFWNATPLTYSGTNFLNYANCVNNHESYFQNFAYSDTLIRNFFKPIVASLNQLGRNNFGKIHMLGLSGGGWETSIYPALDTAIKYSFPIAGSAPVGLWSVQGDYEQRYPPLFNNFLGYEDMYILSATGVGRKVVQINNRYDICCFFGLKHIYYVDSVKNRLAQMGYSNQYSYFLDESHTGHKISSDAIKVVVNALSKPEIQLIKTPSVAAYKDIQYVYDFKGNLSDKSLTVFSLLKAPSWLTFQNGLLVGIPTALSSDTVSIQAKDTLGNYILYTYQISVSLLTSIPESTTIIKVFPNPTAQEIFVQGANGLPIQIYDTNGALIFSETTSQIVTKIDMSQLPKGLYIVRVNSNNVKIVKM